MFTTLLFDIADGVATVTVNRPEKLNALNATVISELGEAVEKIAADSAIRAVILTGAGGKAFVAGADISELAQCDAGNAERLSRTGSAIFRAYERLPKPVIAAVNGFALGGGCELAMACHVRLASENAKFGQPEVKLGTSPGYGGSVRLPRLIGRGRATELLATGGMIDAAEAYRIGLVNRVVHFDQLMDEARKLARRDNRDRARRRGRVPRDGGQPGTPVARRGAGSRNEGVRRPGGFGRFSGRNLSFPGEEEGGFHREIDGETEGRNDGRSTRLDGHAVGRSDLPTYLQSGP